MNRGKRFKSSTIIILIIAIYFTITIMDQQESINAKNLLQGKVLQTIEMEKAKNIKLKEELASVDSKEYIERQAREKLGLVKDGEVVFIDNNK